MRTIFLLVSAMSLSAQQPCTEGPPVPLPPVCGVAVPNPRIACVVPKDAPSINANYNVTQHAFDIFSWEEFIALNWPALPAHRGQPDKTQPISAPGPRVWETWKETSEVYLRYGRKPLPWNVALPKRKVLFRTQKVDDVLDSNIQPTGADGTLPITLTDHRHRVVHYEIRMNEVLFDYVVRNRYYRSRVQERATSIHVPDGSILIKAAWLEIDRSETSQYMSTEADVCDKKGRHCVRRLVGLVGFHIMYRPPNVPQWVWSTFEQKNNFAGAHPNFFDPTCKDCPSNLQTYPGVPNQVARTTPIPSTDPVCSNTSAAVDNIAKLNGLLQDELRAQKTPLASYELISTQWPASAGERDTVFTVVPPNLANTTLETFIQPTSSCMGCHAMARTTRRDRFVSADFTFSLNDALPTLRLPPFDPTHKNSDAVKRAREVTLHTYEIVPQPFVVAKLHCGSCHLKAGTDKKAAWWVGSSERYRPRENLFKRINSCFENSMNGAKICDPDTSCAHNADMMALVTYIDELTQKWRDLRGTETPPCSFPKIAPLTPNPTNGAAVFAQKCAFCHGADGQGRYDSNTYYRPALWGPSSFDAYAGMAKPKTLAKFVHANMPLGSGGELTEQEAWDIAGYIDQQWRPKKQQKDDEAVTGSVKPDPCHDDSQ